MSDLQRLLRELVTQILTEELGQAIKAQPTPTTQAPAATTPPASEHEITEGLLSERMVKTLSAAGHKTLTLGPKVVITPLAREAARFTGMTLKTLDRR